MGYNTKTLFDRIWIKFHPPLFKKGDKVWDREDLNKKVKDRTLLEIIQEPRFVHSILGREWGYVFIHNNEQYFVLEDKLKSPLLTKWDVLEIIRQMSMTLNELMVKNRS